MLAPREKYIAQHLNIVQARIQQANQVIMLNVTQGLASLQKLGVQFGKYKILGHPILHERPQHTQITTIITYLFFKIRHNILIKCHGNYVKEQKIQIHDRGMTLTFAVT